MKFGHYSNAELGIKRNLTCSMFESKGVGVGVGDAQCSTQPLKGQTLRKHLEDLFNRSIGYCRSGRVDWHDYIADYVNEFESDGSTAKANNVLTQFDVEAKQILQKVQTKDFPAGTDMQEAWIQMKLIIANNRAALKRELRSMRMSNVIDDAKDVECGAKPGTKVLSEALLAQHLHDSYDNEPGNGRSLKSYIDASVKHILDIARENDIKRDPALMRKWIKEEIIGAYNELTHLSIKDSPENRKQMKRILHQFDSYITKSVLQARLKNKELFMSNELDDNAADVQCANTKFTEDEIKRCAEEMAFVLKKHFSEGNGKQIESLIRGSVKSSVRVAGYFNKKLKEAELVQRVCNEIRNNGDLVPDRRHDKKRHEALIEAVVKYYTPYIKAQVQSAKQRNKDVFMSNSIDKKSAAKYTARYTNKKKARTLEKKKPTNGTGLCKHKRNIGDEGTN